MKGKIFMALVALFVAFCAIGYAVWVMLQIKSAADAAEAELELYRQTDPLANEENTKNAKGPEGPGESTATQS